MHEEGKQLKPRISLLNTPQVRNFTNEKIEWNHLWAPNGCLTRFEWYVDIVPKKFRNEITFKEYPTGSAGVWKKNHLSFTVK